MLKGFNFRHALSYCCLALLIGLFNPAQSQERRIALVIGNGQYDSLQSLGNPLNDADAMGQSLSALGFTVFLTTNLNQQKFRRAIRFFLSRAEDADTALFYFAGHGATLSGKTYLFPTDFGKDNMFNLSEAIELRPLLDQLGSNLRTNLVFIDACRNNPLQTGEQAGIPFDNTGLQQNSRPRMGTFISFATTPGHIAYDGAGRHSPFTGALLDHLETPGIDVELMMKRVRRDVVVNSRGQQVPWTESSLLTTFRFAPEAAPFTRSDSAETPNIRLPSNLSDSGFSHKPLLDKLSRGFSGEQPTLVMQKQSGEEPMSARKARIKKVLCSLISPPLPDRCSGFETW